MMDKWVDNKDWAWVIFVPRRWWSIKDWKFLWEFRGFLLENLTGGIK